METPVHKVYVISYTAQSGRKMYLHTATRRVGTPDIQNARRFGSLRAAANELVKLSCGNPVIEEHRTYLETEGAVIPEEKIDTYLPLKKREERKAALTAREENMKPRHGFIEYAETPF